ncbi:MAG TPA: hypothetical protein DGG94_09820 [Micromonosporaceae bacterium]|nr:hypothetical protein [Micromonosporaceae bacterium]HCU50081.1 hypothetical protein [Micromonosporaceae bacterium]
MMVVTTDHIPGQKVIRVLGRVLGVTAQRRIPVEAGVPWGRDVPSTLLKDTLKAWRQDAVDNMTEAAHGRGANAVLGMRFDHREVGESWVEICAYGTAVVLAGESKRRLPVPGWETRNIDWKGEEDAAESLERQT